MGNPSSGRHRRDPEIPPKEAHAADHSKLARPSSVSSVRFGVGAAVQGIMFLENDVADAMIVIALK